MLLRFTPRSSSSDTSLRRLGPGEWWDSLRRLGPGEWWDLFEAIGPRRVVGLAEDFLELVFSANALSVSIPPRCNVGLR